MIGWVRHDHFSLNCDLFSTHQMNIFFPENCIQWGTCFIYVYQWHIQSYGLTWIYHPGIHHLQPIVTPSRHTLLYFIMGSSLVYYFIRNIKIYLYSLENILICICFKENIQLWINLDFLPTCSPDQRNLHTELHVIWNHSSNTLL